VPGALIQLRVIEELRSLVDFRGENKIAFRQSINLVSPDLHLSSSPREVNVRMMALIFGDCSNPVHEIESSFEVWKPEFFFDVMVIHDIPAVDLRLQGPDLFGG